MLSRPLNRRPAKALRFQSLKAIERPNSIGKITMAAVNSTAGSTNSACWPRSPRIITWPTHSATPQTM